MRGICLALFVFCMFLIPLSVSADEAEGSTKARMRSAAYAGIVKLAEDGDYDVAMALGRAWRLEAAHGKPEYSSRAVGFYELAAKNATDEEQKRLAEMCALFCLLLSW